ncbi:MAG: hypothetical protein AAF468_11540 [Pseudomonadota bacterium]
MLYLRRLKKERCEISSGRHTSSDAYPSDAMAARHLSVFRDTRTMARVEAKIDKSLSEPSTKN